MRLIYSAALLVSAAAIGYEILLMRVLSIVQWHHFAYMIISLALFGYAASGTAIALGRRFFVPRFPEAFSASALLFSITIVVAFYLAQRVPFNALEIIWNPKQFLGMTVIYLILMVPFFFAAFCIGLAFTCRKELSHKIYFFDLVGAGVGALLIIVALFWLTPPHALVLLSLLALIASMLVALVIKARGRWRLTGLQITTLVMLAYIAPHDLLDLRMSEFKGLSKALQVMNTEVLQVESSPLGLLTVVDSPTIPFRHAPGMSFAASNTPPEQLGVFTDGDDMSVITRFEGNYDRLSYLGDMTSALPYQLLQSPRVLILGAGGGSDVLQALYHDAAHINAVELNPQIINLVREAYGDYAGHVYGDERVTIHLDEVRGFVSRSETDYDLIQLALLDSFATSGSGAQGLSESYLYTVQAVTEYFEHLSADGVLSITRWLRLPARDSLKLAATAIETLRRSGLSEPGRHLAVIRSWNTVTFVIGRIPLSAQRIETIRTYARSRSFDTAWYPGMTSAEANRYNRLDDAPLFNGISELLSENADNFVDAYKFDISPATDDKPYFFHFFKWSVFPEMMELARQGGAGLIEWGYLVLIATFVQATLAGLLIVLLPLRLIARSWDTGFGTKMGSYFFLLGLAFLFVEIAFIQKFILFLSHPLYSVAVVLSGFLIFAGIGSAASGKLLTTASEKQLPPVTIAVAGIAIISLAYLWLLPILFDQWIGLPDAAKIAISIAIIAPLAFCMGMPFPIGLKSVAAHAPGFIPWAWGINGFASVVSATLATLLAIEFGFTIVLLLAIALYGAATVLISQSPLPAAPGSTG